MRRLLFSLSLILFFTTQAIAATNLEGIRLSQSANDSRLVLDLSEQVEYKVFTLKNPQRLVIDLFNSQKSAQFSPPDLSRSTIKKIRFSSPSQPKLRVVFDLANKLTFKSQLLKPSQGHSHRLVVDLHSATPFSVTLPKPAVEQQPVKKPPVPPVPVKETPAKLDPIKTPAVATPIPTPIKSVNTMVKRDIIIAIDAGHGGQDSGALGHSGTKEKTIVLAIAKRLAKLVNKEPGMKAYMIRDRDEFIPLRQRIKRAHDHKADMFISIHADAFTNSQAKGASVFVLSERGASSEAAQLLADKENAADLAGGISLVGKDDLLAFVLLDLSQTASLEASLEVGNTVLAGLKRVGNVHKKHVESAGFAVLKSPDIPSILVETAFISNPAEERKLKTASHQNKLARAVMSGIRSYFQRNPLVNSSITQQHIVSSGDTLSTISQRYQVSVASIKSKNKLSTSLLKIGQVLLVPN
ncbi:MAG: N-acetylmuramoyl-L-alanine amidase [Gammaproteobacteria bacterium]|nr:MAG: N-acetylmuramoyl-L-alanine amidase [Gammaproteobacteria bacterium]